MTIEINDKKFYIIFAQFKQQQKEMDRNIVEAITVRTDQSKCKIVIRTIPENTAQCFDVASQECDGEEGDGPEHRGNDHSENRPVKVQDRDPNNTREHGAML